MKKIFKNLLPALVCTAAVGCSTITPEEMGNQQFSAEQIEFQANIKVQEAAQIDAFKAEQKNNSAININETIDKINESNDALKSFVAENNGLKKQVLSAARTLIATEKKKLSNSTMQDQYWKFVEHGKELEALQVPTRCTICPTTWFAGDEVDEFEAEEFRIALQINKQNQAKSAQAYDNLKNIIKSNVQGYLADCKKELAEIDKKIAAEKAATELSNDVFYKTIDDDQEVLNRYNGAQQ